jgi:hypothetical protein
MKKLVIVALVIGVLFVSTGAHESLAAFFPHIGTSYKTKAGYFFASTPDALQNALILAKDKKAFKKLFVQGRAVILRPNMIVYCDDVNISGMVKIRPEGETDGVWTLIGALQPLP